MEIWDAVWKLAPVLGPTGTVLATAVAYLVIELREERKRHEATRARYELMTDKRHGILEESVSQTKSIVLALGEMREQLENLQRRTRRGG